MFKNGFNRRCFYPCFIFRSKCGSYFRFIFQNFSPTLDLNLLTVASMSAFASCVIGGPVANMMIILELTSNYRQLLLVRLCLSLISYKVIGQSVFDKVLSNKNIDLKVGRKILNYNKSQFRLSVTKIFVR